MPGRPVDCDLQPRICANAKRVDGLLCRRGWRLRSGRGRGEAVIVDLSQAADNPGADRGHGIQARLVEHVLFGAREAAARRRSADKVILEAWCPIDKLLSEMED